MTPEYTQVTPEWHAVRAKRITSSDAPVIMNVAVYGPKTLYDLFCHKTGLSQQAVTPAMRKGSQIEPIERDRLSIEMGVAFEPAVFMDDWRMCSLDGISPDGSIIIEIKSCQKATLYDIMDGKVPRHFFCQIQHHLSMVPSAKHCILACVCDDQRIQAEIFRDSEFISELIAREKDFYDNYLSKMIPPPNENGEVALMDESLFSLEKQYSQAKREKEEIEERMEHLYALIRERVGSVPKAKGKLFTYSTSQRVSYDLKKACTDAGIDMEKYKKPTSTVFTIREIVKDKNNIAMED
jgi:putative phage-type endonuclease